MPIAGKTTTLPAQRLQTERLGKAWKGAKKQANRAGKDLEDRFRLELPSPYDSVINAAYGSMEPKSLRVLFPFNTTDEVFETWNDAFTAKGMSHRCNGDRIVRKITTKTAYRGGKSYPQPVRVDCDEPCLKGADETICSKCTSTGYLNFIVRELFLTAGMSKTISQTVTGITDVLGIWQQLKGFEQKYGSLKNSPVPSPSTWGFIPFLMQRVPREISRPMYDSGKKSYTEGRTRGTTYPIIITEDPQWLAHWQMVTRRSQIQGMIQGGQAHLLMGEDLAIAQKMMSLTLPGAAPAAIPVLSEAQEQPQLAPSFEPVSSEDVADEFAIEESGDPALAHAESLINRPSKERLAAVNKHLGIDREAMFTLWDDQTDPSKEECDRATQMIEAMLLQYAMDLPIPIAPEQSWSIIHRLQGDIPTLVDEGLAAMFVEEISKATPPVKLAQSEPATVVNGKNID